MEYPNEGTVRKIVDEATADPICGVGASFWYDKHSIKYTSPNMILPGGRICIIPRNVLSRCPEIAARQIYILLTRGAWKSDITNTPAAVKQLPGDQDVTNVVREAMITGDCIYYDTDTASLRTIPAGHVSGRPYVLPICCVPRSCTDADVAELEQCVKDGLAMLFPIYVMPNNVDS